MLFLKKSKTQKTAQSKTVFFLITFFYLVIPNQYFPQEKIDETPSENIEVWLSASNTYYTQILSSIQIVSKKKIIVRHYSDDIKIENFKVEKDTSLYITLGLPATKFILRHVLHKPILFTMVYAPKTHNLNQSNLCGFSIEISLSEYIQTMKEIKPDIKNIYAIYSDSTGKFISGEGEYLEGKFGIIYNRIEVSDSIEMEALFKKLKNAEAIFLPLDQFFKQEIFAAISKFSKENHIILATSFQGFTDEGATFSISPYYSNIGLSIGERINSMIEQKIDCKDGAITSPKDHFLYLNQAYARESNIVIPEKLLKRSQSDQLFNSAIMLFENDKLKSAEIVVRRILKEDSENKKAKNLAEMIQKKMTGEKTDALLKAAEEQMMRKNYTRAKQIYRDILQISPNREEANNGLSNIRKLESGDISSAGEKYFQAGDIYASIRKYLEAIQVWNENKIAMQKLSEVRVKESINIPEYLKKAILLYQQRNYRHAISDFENILLIDPVNKTAIDYLQLAKQKEKAIKTLNDCKNSKDTNCKLLWK